MTNSSTTPRLTADLSSRRAYPFRTHRWTDDGDTISGSLVLGRRAELITYDPSRRFAEPEQGVEVFITTDGTFDGVRRVGMRRGKPLAVSFYRALIELKQANDIAPRVEFPPVSLTIERIRKATGVKFDVTMTEVRDEAQLDRLCLLHERVYGELREHHGAWQ